MSKDNLLVRLGSNATAAALAQPHVRVFDMASRPMKNWILVEPAGIQTDDDLKRWVEQGVAFAQSLPPK